MTLRRLEMENLRSIVNGLCNLMKAAIVLLAISLLVLGCSSGLKVSTDYDKSFDFSTLSTYNVVLGEFVTNTARRPNPLVVNRMADAIRENLQLKGYTPTDDLNSADFVVVMHGGTQQKTEIRESGVYYGGYGYGGYGWGTTDIDTYDYTEGSVVFDVVEMAGKKPIWHSAGTDVIKDEPLSEEEVNEIVEKMLADFPAKQKISMQEQE